MSVSLKDSNQFDQTIHPELEPALQVEQIVSQSSATAHTGRKFIPFAMDFLLGQGASQALNLITGIFLIHRLSIEAYAQFGVATGFQGVMGILMDLGFASTIIPLVGERAGDRAVIGRYVRAAHRLRNLTFWLLAPLTAIAFLATVHKRHWPLGLQLVLLISILVSLYSSGMVSFFSAPLLITRRLREYYLPQILVGFARVLAYVALAFAGSLNAATAAIFGGLYVTANGLLIRRAARKHLDWPTSDSPETHRELLRYILPGTPAVVFAAFQSQISLFLISFFGSTLYIAEVAALTRIGQIFIMLTVVHTTLVEPYIAKLPRQRLLHNYLTLLLVAIAACAPVVFIAFRWPDVFIWIIGSRFETVRPAIGVYILSLCLNFVSGLAWIMNRARKWVFWSGSILEVVLLLGSQILFLAFIGVHTTQQAVLLALVSSGCYIIAHGYIGLRGFLQAPSHS
jgi:O-antigen/teichoic acid export membrane protein